MKVKYLVFDLFGTITKRRYLPAVFEWYLSGKKPSRELIDPEFINTLATLSNKYVLCILSNADHRFVRGSLSKSRLDRYFKHIVISSEVGARKPSREAFERLIKLGVSPEQSVFIDDRKANRVVAEQMGFTILDFSDKVDLLGKLFEL